MRKRIFAVMSAVCILFSGCAETSDERDGYNVYSGGNLVSEEKLPDAESDGYEYADFYIPEGMVTDYYSRYCLTDTEKEIYDEIRKVMGSHKDRTPLTMDGKIYDKVLKVIRFENLGFPHVSRWGTEYVNGEFEVHFTYRMTADEISSMNMAAEEAAKSIIAQLSPDMDDYEKVKFFHDYLVLNCENDTKYPFADTVYGALVENKAHCEGYSKAFSYLCNLAGIENTIVTGETYVDHMWNMVKIGGNWYHVDVTWDNPDDQLTRTFSNVILYQYFMITDDVISNTHTIIPVCEVPQAFGTAENYFSREGTDVSDKSELLPAAENAIISAVKNGSSSAMIKFDTTDTYYSCIGELKNQELFNPIIEKVSLEYGRNIKLSWTDFYGQYRIITFIIE